MTEQKITLDERIKNDFKYHPPSQAAIDKHQAVRVQCERTAHFINANCPSGREKSLALTNLELVMFWANAAIARNG